MNSNFANNLKKLRKDNNVTCTKDGLKYYYCKLKNN